MSYEQKDGQGVLFPVQDKETSQHPDLTGNVRINGQDFWVSAWKKTSKDGSKKYLSLSVKPKQPKAPPKSLASEPPPEDFNDPLPF